MEGKPQPGYLALATINGFPSNLANTDLEHAQQIRSELLELIVERLIPLMTRSKHADDVAFVYAPEASMPPGQTLMELIEAAYATFRTRIARSERATSCGCAACKAIPALTPTFFVHYGTFLLQRVSGNAEVVGEDVKLAHQLRNNHIGETTGWRAYALFTAASLQRLGLEPGDLQPLTEHYAQLGEVQTFSMDLQQRYTARAEARRVRVTPEAAQGSCTLDLPATAPAVWAWFNELERRQLFMHEVTWSALDRPHGRIGVGARNHCNDHNLEIIEEIADWRPFEYWTIFSDMKLLGRSMRAWTTYQLEPIPTGTRVTICCSVEGGMPIFIRRLLVKKVMIVKHAETLGYLRTRLQTAAPAIAEEPVGQA